MKRPVKRTLVFYLVGIMFSYLILELLSFATLQALEVLRPRLFVGGFVDSHFDAITSEARAEFIADAYDPDLGWDNRPLYEYHWRNSLGQPYLVSYEADGSRADSLPRKNLLINAYGDSFTWCDEVGNDETWEYFLESRIGYEVKNFGVGAYGTDQAILKLERHLAQGISAPITILGILDENINRVITSFRPFYDEFSGVVLGFKPSFKVGSNGRVEMIPNPYGQAESSLQDLRALAHRMAAEDFWMSKSRRITIGYPYIFQLVRTASFIVDRKLDDWSGSEAHYTEGVNLWETADGSTIMHYLVDRFVGLTAKSDSIPIVVFLPTGKTLEDGGTPPYETFKSQIQERHAGLTVIDLMDYEFDRERFNVKPFGGHASVYGNQVIARVIEQSYEKIRNEGKLTFAASELPDGGAGQ